MTPRPDTGSFRDPLSRVFADDTSILRGFASLGADDFAAVEQKPFFAKAIADGQVVGTERVDPASVGLGDWAAALRHERISPITYPYEWSFEMLRDAALLQLALTRAALADGCITKDATPYNVQFVGSRPVFIDVGSFEPYRKGEPWYGYGQFCQLNLNPLVLQAVCDTPFHASLRGRLDGIPPGEVKGLLSFRDRRRKGMFSHVVLHARAQDRFSDESRDVKGELKSAGFGAPLIDAQLRGLTKTVNALKWKASESTWSTYSDRAHYGDEALQAKEAFVRKVVSAQPRKLVLDLGANDGHFSRLAAEHSERVVAVDGDHLVIDRLYRTLKSEGNEQILPLVLNLADPSPSTGWRGRERTSFVDRVRPDVVLCLAVVHHMALTNTVPLPEIVGYLHDFGAETVVEFPHRDDEMVKRLLRHKREGIFTDYELDNWEKALEQQFDIHERVLSPTGTRTLYRATPR